MRGARGVGKTALLARALRHLGGNALRVRAHYLIEVVRWSSEGCGMVWHRRMASLSHHCEQTASSRWFVGHPKTDDVVQNES